MNPTPQSYPLHWPLGKPRAKYRENARFDTSFARARDGLALELERLGARNTILSTNIELRLDGRPYANRANPMDPGVAVYFKYKGKSFAFACDRWRHVEDNIQAIRKTIEALRGIARWGTGDMMEAAFAGYAALPDAASNECWSLLGLDPSTIPPGSEGIAKIKSAYRAKAMTAHPDTGGSHEAMAKLNDALDQALKLHAN